MRHAAHHADLPYPVLAPGRPVGSEAVLEGKKARSFPLRFADGAVLFGPVKVGQVPPLF